MEVFSSSFFGEIVVSSPDTFWKDFERAQDHR